jgi:S-formylglutathione hydrolase FrmB
METRSERAESTLAAIVGAALDMAVTEGLESISIGEVAKRLDLSKSGVFSRVGSREQLHPHLFEQACAEAGQPLNIRRHEGYDHGYYFIASFVEDHLRHHATTLTA